MPETRERFIPFRAADLIARLTRDPRVAEGERDGLRSVAALVRALIHHDFHDRLERLKALYAPFDPDSDTRSIEPPPAGALEGLRRDLLAELGGVLERANYSRLTQEDLNRALSEESVFQVQLHTRLDDFADLVLYCRGSSVAEEPRSAWFGLKRWTQRVEYFQRVAIYTRFRDQDWFVAAKRRNLPFKPGSSILKLFQNIPKADLEMLFPNTDVRMKVGQRLMVGVPAIAGGVVVLVTKLGASLILVGVLVGYWIGLAKDPGPIGTKELVALGLGLVALGGYLWRQINAFKNRKAKFLKALSDSLYYRNLDNNAGVFNRLVDEAEEEEGKEAVLAYAFLLTARKPLTRVELDQAIEAWLRDSLKAELDFEIDDGVAKLERLALVEKDGDRLRAVPLDEARRRLDARWDGLYTAP